jgi:hypothetical protein
MRAGEPVNQPLLLVVLRTERGVRHGGQQG